MTAGEERGVAVLVAVLAMSLLSALGASLVLATSVDTTIARNFRGGIEARYAADAVAEWVLDELSTVPAWDAVLDGSARSSFTDGSPGGERTVGTQRINLDQVRDLARCGRPAGCTDAAMDASTARRPWGVNNPRWQLYAHGPLRGLDAFAGAPAGLYVVALVADDGLEDDGNPLRDGPEGSAGSGTLAVRAHAFGRNGARAGVELTASRAAPGDRLRVVVRSHW
jgi:hypothetical protein